MHWKIAAVKLYEAADEGRLKEYTVSKYLKCKKTRKSVKKIK